MSNGSKIYRVEVKIGGNQFFQHRFSILVVTTLKEKEIFSITCEFIVCDQQMMKVTRAISYLFCAFETQFYSNL